LPSGALQYSRHHTTPTKPPIYARSGGIAMSLGSRISSFFSSPSAEQDRPPQPSPTAIAYDDPTVINSRKAYKPMFDDHETFEARRPPYLHVSFSLKGKELQTTLMSGAELTIF